MKKKQPIKNKPVQPERIKDPKKVAAGKARAATALKDKSGRYVSAVLAAEVKRTLAATKGFDVSKVHADNAKKIDAIMKEAKISKTQVANFYKRNRDVFDDMIETGEIVGTSKNSNQITEATKKYKGKKIVIDEGNGKKKEVTKAQAQLQFDKFKQVLSSELNVVDIVLKPRLSFDGAMSMKIPNTKKLIKDLEEYFGKEKGEDFDFGDFDGAEISEAIESIFEGYYGNEAGEIQIFAS